MINTKNLQHRLMAIKFAIWDLHLYLITHPDDCEAMEIMKDYKEKYRSVLDEYEYRFGAITFKDDENCTWTTVPFPWVNNGSDC